MIVSIDDARSELHRLVERAAAGEDIVIGRAGRPLVRMVPYVAERRPRRPGMLHDRIWIAPDFDESPEWLTEAFEGHW